MAKGWKHQGAYGELAACLWLLIQGYEVFRNVSAHGIIDLVAIKGAEILKLDVKSLMKLEAGNPLPPKMLKAEQIQAGVKPLYVLANGEFAIDYEPKQSRDSMECERCGETIVRRTRLQKYCRTCGPAVESEKKLKKQGLDPIKPVACACCGQPFKPTIRRQKFCCSDCRTANYKQTTAHLVRRYTQ